MKENVTRGEVNENQDGGLSLEDKQCTQKLPRLCQNKSHMFQHYGGIKKPSHCSMSILRASNGRLHITCAEKFYQLCFPLPFGGTRYLMQSTDHLVIMLICSAPGESSSVDNLHPLNDCREAPVT